MSDHHDRDSRLAHLEGLVASQQARLAALERPPRRRARRLLPLALAALLVALVPLATLAANPFTDLVAGSVHNADIEAIYGAGITTGCVPGAQYCPTAPVTRQEMASFLARTAGLGANPPVANARTLQGYTPSGLTRVAQGLGTNTTGNDFTITANTVDYQELPGATVTIEVPGSGYVLVNSSVSVTSFANIAVLARVRDVSPGAPPSAISPTASRSDAGDFGTGMLNVAYVFPVSGTGAKTFRLEVARTSGSPAARNGVVTALFVPFGATGFAP